MVASPTYARPSSRTVALGVKHSDSASTSASMGGGRWMGIGGRWRYPYEMARTHEKVRDLPESKPVGYTPVTAASGVEQAFKFLEGRWKLVILFHLFGGKMLRFSDLQRAIPAISQKM